MFEITKHAALSKVQADILRLCFQGGIVYGVQEAVQRSQVVFWVASQVGCVCGRRPLPAVHGHPSAPPQVHQFFQDGGVAQGIVFTEEEEGGGGDGVFIENLDAALVDVCRVSLEEPEVEHCGVFDKTLQTWHQSLAEAWTTRYLKKSVRIQCFFDTKKYKFPCLF